MIRKKPIYFDNCTTSYPKAGGIYKKAGKFMEKAGVMPNFGKYELALEAGKLIYNTREKTAKIFNIQNPLDIAFTSGGKESFNLLLRGYLKKGDHVIITVFSHDAIIAPIKKLEEEGVQVSIVEVNNKGFLDAIQIDWAIRENTRLILTTQICHITGVHLPIKEIGEIAKKHNLPYCVDASYSGGLYPLDVEEANVSFLIFTGHRYLMGPQGVGGIYIRKGYYLDKVFEGDSGKEIDDTEKIMPDYLETGSMNILGITAFNYALDVVLKLDRNKENKKMKEVYEYLYLQLTEMEEIRVLNKKLEENINILNFVHKKLAIEDIREIMDEKYNIALRDGYHSGRFIHEKLNIEKSIKISLAYTNTIEEAKTFIKALKEINKLA